MAAGRAPGSKLHDGPLYRSPMIPLLATAAALPAIGQARMAVRTFRERMSERMIMSLGAKQADLPTARATLARAEIESRGAELMLRDAVDQLCSLRDEATLEDRARMRAQIALAVERCRSVVDTICAASGASAHLRSHPLQRARRDLNMMAAHTVFDVDASMVIYGGSLAGHAPKGVLI